MSLFDTNMNFFLIVVRATLEAIDIYIDYPAREFIDLILDLTACPELNETTKFMLSSKCSLSVLNS